MAQKQEITIYDIAKKLGVSPTTVSRALKGNHSIGAATTRKILEVADMLGYQRNAFAANLRQKHTHTIGVIVPRLNSSFMSAAISGIEEAAGKEGFNIMICQSNESFEKEVELAKVLYNKRIDGLLISFSLETIEYGHVNSFLRKRVPVILFDRVSNEVPVTQVVIDNFKASFTLVSYLINQGFTRIVHVAGPGLRENYRWRTEGYLAAMNQAGLTLHPEQVIISDLRGDDIVSILEKIKRLDPFPDAIFASNDATAIKLMMGLQELGYQVPGQIAVAGFNNDPESLIVFPKLTTVAQPAYEIGKIAAARLIRQILDEPGFIAQEMIYAKWELLERASTQLVTSVQAHV